MASQRAIDISKYAASFIDKATTNCNLDFQIVGQVAYRKIQPFLDFAVLGSVGTNILSQYHEKSAP